MKTRQSGFTLIELVMVIVLIGVLAAIAVPKFVDLSGDAKQAAVDGVAGALSSAAAINYASRKANVANGVAVDNCDDIGPLLQGGLPTGYTVTAAAIAAEATASCTVTAPGGAKTSTFSVTGIV